MFRIKICGITNVEDAIAAVDAGADALGLNFYKKSPRCVELDVARKIAAATEVVRVGVFVNHSTEEMAHAWNEASLSYTQIHGDETPEMLKPIADMGIIPVRRLSRDETDPVGLLIRDFLHFTSEIGWALEAMLVDAAVPGEYGGTGAKADWHSLHGYELRLDSRAGLILAGGLTPDNVAEAIRIVRPAAVDVASGVESAPGKKDPVKVRDFVAAASEAFASLGASDR
ncbi:phosphoribosylanthranilate isomerase [Lacipirellula parvula]|uniref:N-(5'-phosphoribosyl)anthranilate isomerase n=1 Tax=Lacipirellula parvula TaxID=2650471 RepID=A0A5K7X5E6_9BACT|nr:phosphoribosylanthranilate isomerase [Lacipirellula parvula]BBO31750.1 phosphoribosylanthranilate isomerase [Lacipirellula parvula]